jgi:S-adenosylmethionine/arginine decarboxylase-like enzyme
MTINAWGKHLIVDASGCKLVLMKDTAFIADFTKDLVKEIDMVAYGEPQIIHFGSGDKEGFTLVQLIETSNISGHFANDLRAIFLDVFSCKDFDEKIVIEMVRNWFGAEDVNYTILRRVAYT